MRLAAGLGGLVGVGLAGVAVFSDREEPIQRLVNLIKAMRGKRR